MTTISIEQKQVITQVANMTAKRGLKFGLSLKQGYGVGGAIAGCMFMEESDFSDKVETYVASAKVNGEFVSVSMDIVHKLGLINSDNTPTEGFMKFWEEAVKERGLPHQSGVFTRRVKFRTDKKGRNDNNTQVLAALDAVESTLYTVDTQMLAIAKELCLPADKYVLNGCLDIVKQGNKPSASEFSTDDRGRMYHKSCHGPNGQAGDMQRALMNLYGRVNNKTGEITTIHNNYDINAAIRVLMNEMADMIGKTTVEAEFDYVVKTGSVETIRQCLSGEYSNIKKPWSFVKACFLLAELKAGKRPHIGMAFGFDAKCSGPQLAAVTVGDSYIAQACGFGYTQVADAYAHATNSLKAEGFGTVSRDGIKKAYMGIFYGQGAGAYGTTATEKDAKIAALNGVKLDWIHEELVNIIQGDEKKAKKFHAIVSNCFGKKVGTLRRIIKTATKDTQDKLEAAGYYSNLNVN